MSRPIARHHCRGLAGAVVVLAIALTAAAGSVAQDLGGKIVNIPAAPPTDDSFPPGGVMPVGWATSPGANAGWVVASDSTNLGPNSLKSAIITDGQSAAIQVTGNFVAGSVGFAYQVSSELGGDFFNFYIDDVAQFPQVPDPGVSGEVAWTSTSFPVSAGTHTFKWVYAKDPSVSTGSDAAWIDTVTLPPVRCRCC